MARRQNLSKFETPASKALGKLLFGHSAFCACLFISFCPSYPKVCFQIKAFFFFFFLDPSQPVIKIKIHQTNIIVEGDLISCICSPILSILDDLYDLQITFDRLTKNTYGTSELMAFYKEHERIKDLISCYCAVSEKFLPLGLHSKGIVMSAKSMNSKNLKS